MNYYTQIDQYFALNEKLDASSFSLQKITQEQIKQPDILFKHIEVLMEQQEQNNKALL